MNRRGLAETLDQLSGYLRYQKLLGVEGLALSPAGQKALAGLDSLPRTVAPPAAEGRSAPAGDRLSEQVPAAGDLPALAREAAGCERCGLCQTRTKVVFGEGDPKAELMFIGEGPGRDEDLSGRPFVGRAGQLLTKIIAAMGFERDQVYITNVVKCRPPGNRDPLKDEMDVCVPTYLEKQIEAIQPKVIATLGRFSMALFFPKNVRISKIHGQPKRADGRIYYPLFHPAAVLRNPNLRPVMESDFKRMRDLLKEIEESGGKMDDDPPELTQLSLF